MYKAIYSKVSDLKSSSCSSRSRDMRKLKTNYIGSTNNSNTRAKEGGGTLIDQECQCIRIQYRNNVGLIKRISGIILTILSFAVLAWNENIAVESSRNFYEGVSLVLPITSEELLPENENRLVHVNGFLEIPETLQDLTYGVSIPAVKLKRRVQMFQWVEEQKSNADSDFEESYLYKRGWKDKLVDSSDFISPETHANPESFSIPSEIRINDKVRIGHFVLGEELKERFNNFVQFTSAERPDSQDIKMHMGLYYHSADIWNPGVGNFLKFLTILTYLEPQEGKNTHMVSIIAKQSGSNLIPFYTESGAKIAYIHEGKMDHFEIFKIEHSQSVIRCFFLRIGAWIFSIFGVFFASRSISLKAFTGRKTRFLKNLMILGSIKFSIIFGSYIALTIISCIWITHKLIFGTLLFIFSISLLVYMSKSSININEKNEMK